MKHILLLTGIFSLIGCVGGASVYTSGDTVDTTDFKGVLSINGDEASGDLKNNPILHSLLERKSVDELREKYGNMDSYAVLLPTATPEELKMTAPQALYGRGYTHLLIAAINPSQSHTRTGSNYNHVTGMNETKSSTYHSMDISCTVYRLSDGKAISYANADSYSRDKNIFSRAIGQSALSSETYVDRLHLGVIYSCDEAMKAVTSQLNQE